MPNKENGKGPGRKPQISADPDFSKKAQKNHQKNASSTNRNPYLPPETEPVIAVSVKSAIQIIFYLMAVDGQVYHSEEERFELIATELDPRFAVHKDLILFPCQHQLKKIIDDSDHYYVIQDGVETALMTSRTATDSFISSRLLVWNLLTIAYSDNQYDVAERRLIKYVVRKLNMDKSVFLEMESSIQTLYDLENELSWIKTTSRPYLTIETMVNEISDRKNVITSNVHDLIML